MIIVFFGYLKSGFIDVDAVNSTRMFFLDGATDVTDAASDV